MYYSETKVILGGLAHVPVLILIVNFIKGKFESTAEKIIEVKKTRSKFFVNFNIIPPITKFSKLQ